MLALGISVYSVVFSSASSCSGSLRAIQAAPQPKTWKIEDFLDQTAKHWSDRTGRERATCSWAAAGLLGGAPPFALTGTMIMGSVSAPPVTAGTAEQSSAGVVPCRSAQHSGDRQITDRKTKATIAEGNVSVQLGDAELRADRTNSVVFARPRTRCRDSQPGNQYFQAPSLPLQPRPKRRPANYATASSTLSNP